MKKFNVLVMSGVAVCLALGVAGTSGATQITNATLSIPFSAGSGNSNVNFAIDTNSGVEVGLKAKERKVGDVPTIGNVYYVKAGSHQTDNAAYADWNFDWSVYLNNGKGVYTAIFSYDMDPATVFASYAGTTRLTLPVPLTGMIRQDSWNYGMGGSGFNTAIFGTYDIDLSVYNSVNQMVADSHIQVVVGDGAAPVPEPGTMMLLGLGMAGLAFYGKRRMNKEA